MVEHEFVVKFATSDAGDKKRLEGEMARALSVWMHREVAVESVDSTQSTDA